MEFADKSENSKDHENFIEKDQEIHKNEKEQEEEEEEEKSNLKGDYGNFTVLLFLYLLQGIPLGCTSSLIILLQNRGISYKQQALFTFASYPFSMKILWAPIVDAVYFKKFGRRKSWICPIQVFIGFFMLFLGQSVNGWIESTEPKVLYLTIAFFFLWLLTATQDIAVDGWCLTMLKKRNVAHAATVGIVGQTAGWFTGYVILLIFESKEFCNKFIYSQPQDEGLITLSGFFSFWGIVYLATTTFLIFFKKEEQLEVHTNYGIKKAYPILLKIIQKKPVLKFAFILFTIKASYITAEEITRLKLIEYGVPKDSVALFSIPLVPIQLALPFIISRYTTSKPMLVYLKAFPYRLVMVIVVAVFVYFTPKMVINKVVPMYYYVAVIIIYMVLQIPARSMDVAAMSFLAKIADRSCGGTYITLMTTIGNLGGSGVSTFLLWLVDIISWKQCILDNQNLLSTNSTSLPLDNKCIDLVEKETCVSSGGKCHFEIDGYFIEVCLCLIYGIIWFYFGRKLILYLQNLPAKEWYVDKNTKKNENVEEVIPLEPKENK